MLVGGSDADLGDVESQLGALNRFDEGGLLFQPAMQEIGEGRAGAEEPEDHTQQQRTHSHPRAHPANMPERFRLLHRPS